MGKYLDILNGGNTPDINSNPSPGNTVGIGSLLAPVPATPALVASPRLSLSAPVQKATATGSPANMLTQFRSVASQLQSNANMSVQQEILRICNLPIVPEPTPEEIKAISDYYITNPTPPFDKGLYPAQVKALMQFHDYGSLFCPVPVAGGKTLISVLIANDAYRDFHKRKIILMNPVNLIGQLRTTELPLYRRHMSINIPFYWLTKESKHQRLLTAKSNRGGCYVVSYSLLSGQSGAEILDAIQPDLIIGDEVHRIASARPSARNRRFKEVVNKYNPSLVVMSGTITKKSPKDYHWIATQTLQHNSFMPRPKQAADAWSEILDCEASTADELNPNGGHQAAGPIMHVAHWADKNIPDKEFPNNLLGFRTAAKERMRTAPGVILPEATGKGYVPLRISNIKLSKQDCTSRPGWDKLQEIVKVLLDEYIAPNGDEIDHAMHIYRWRYELEGFGFYNNLVWPDAEKVAVSRDVTENVAHDLLERSIEHHEARQEYHRVLRQWIKHRAKTGMDTPMLIGQEMYMNGAATVGDELHSAWSKVRELKFDGILERQKSVVRVCDFRLNKIIEWAKAWYKKKPNKACIIWFLNRGVGDWLAEAFREADLPATYCPSGKKGTEAISAKDGRTFTIASSSYTEGQNLQHTHDAEVFAQWYRPAFMIEQAMGRIDRPGQDSDQARYFMSISSEFDQMLLASTLNDAAYTHQINSPHKLMYADWDERPKVVPSAALLEWSGGEQPVQMLSADKQKMLLDKFKGE